MSLNAILLLFSGFLGANLLTADLISPYFNRGSGVLWFHLAALTGFLVFITLGSRSAKWRWWFVVVWTVIFVGGAFVRQISLRGPVGQPVGIHDGAIHVEVAAEVFRGGQNPYQAEFRHTRYGELNPPIPGGPAINVVWSHFIYPPLTFVLQTPWSAIGSWFGFVADVRWLMLASLGLAAGLIISTTKDYDRRIRLWLLTAANPLVWLYVIAGYNDMWVITALILTAWSIDRRRWWLTGVALACAAGLKQSAWIVIPLVAWYLWRSAPDGARKKALVGFVVAGLLIWGPWAVWDPGALVDDIVRYASGSIPFSYPISGATFLQYLHIYNFVESPWTVIPTHWFQLAIGLPTLGALAWWLRKHYTLHRLLTAITILTTAVLLVSRYNNNNYISGIILLSVAAYAFRAED